MKAIGRTIKYGLFAAWCLLVYGWMSPAWATDKPAPTPEPKATATATSSSAAEADAAAQAAASAHADAKGGAGGNGGGGGNASASNDGVSVNVESQLQAPSTFSAAATPTAPCYYVNGWNASAPGVGGGRFKAKVDDDCVIRERARLLIEAGRPDLAVYLLVGHEIPAQMLESATASSYGDTLLSTGESEPAVTSIDANPEIPKYATCIYGYDAATDECTAPPVCEQTCDCSEHANRVFEACQSK